MLCKSEAAVGSWLRQSSVVGSGKQREDAAAALRKRECVCQGPGPGFPTLAEDQRDFRIDRLS